MTLSELLEADAIATEGKTGCLIVPSFDTGHATHQWDKDDPEDVAEARKTFNKLKGLGYSFFRVDPKSGDKGQQIKDFDPAAGKIIATPAFAGG